MFNYICLTKEFNMKKCCKCKKEYPKTKEYFFVRKIKQYNAKGDLKIYNSFRSFCKSCHGKQGGKLKIRKRCEELNCDVSDYRKKWKEQYTETRTSDLKAKEILTEGQYNHYLKLLRNGIITTVKEYFIQVEKSKEERNERLVSGVLDRQKYFTKEDKRLALRMYAKNEMYRLTDAYVSNLLMRRKISDLTPEIIETKRITIQLKRELKSNNIKIR